MENIFFRIVLFASVLYVFSAGPGGAADYQSLTTEELSAIRGTLSDATQDERDAFRSEWTSRLNEMTPAEREQYTGPGPGRGNGLKDGSGMGGGNAAGNSDAGNGNGPGDGGGSGGSGSGGNGNSGNGGGGNGRS